MQVAFIEWTVHDKLRHPRLLGIRTDKSAREVVRERRVITHPEKVLFPDDGITKGALAAYYEAIASIMLPHIKGRPITMERYPSGIGRKGFIQKDVSKGFPAWLERVEVPKKDGTVHHPVVGRHSLAALARQPELHHAARVDVARTRLQPPRHLRLRSRPVERGSGRASRRSARAARPAERARASRAGSRPPARRASTSSFRSTARPTSAPSTASRTPSAPCSSRAIRSD